MNIPLNKLLQKMEEEIRAVKSASSEAQVREKVQAIKTLCELVLDESGDVPQSKVTPSKNVVVGAPLQVQSQPIRQMQGRQLEDADANGDSLFDF